MNIFQLGIRSVWRKRIRSMLLLFIVYMATVFIYAGWACSLASVRTQDSTRQAVGASFRLETNGTNRHKRLDELAKALDEQIGENQSGTLNGYHRQQLPNGSWMVWTDNSFETLIIGDIEKIAGVSGIRAYNITTANTVVNPVNFERIEDKDVDQSSDPQGVSLRGTMDMSLDADVQKGNIAVYEGRMVQNGDENVCVVSRELAELNQLQIGDVLSFNQWKERETSPVYSAVVVGIYDAIQPVTPITNGDSYRSENIIFTDLSFPEKAEGCENNPLYQYATFMVENVDEYEQVRQSILETEIDWEYYDLLDNTGMSDTMAENFSGLKNMSELMLVLIITASVLILSFVFLFWMKNRYREIGILLSIGKRKWEVVCLMLMEGVLIGMVAFLLATVSAGYVAEVTADYLVETQVELDKEQSQSEQGMVSVSEKTGTSEVVGVSVEIDAEIVLLTAISTMGILIVSVGLSSTSVALQKPKDILSKMS